MDLPRLKTLARASPFSAIRSIHHSLITDYFSFLKLIYPSGSYTHTWMLKEHPNIVARSCFVDPVTFCSWEGGQRPFFVYHATVFLIPSLWLDVCYNFFYREPATVSSSLPIEKLDGAHNQDQGLELLMRYFVGSELGVSNVLQRHFCWTSNSLWFEEIPNATDQSKTFFCMGGKDIIVNTEVSDKSLSHAHYLTKLVACQTLSYIPRRSKKHLV